MKDTPRQQERRAAARYASPPIRVDWRRGARSNGGPTAAWLRDTSTCGVSFVTATAYRPNPGDSIELTFGEREPHPRRRQVRVVRTVPYDRFFSTVGCEIAEAAGAK